MPCGLDLGVTMNESQELIDNYTDVSVRTFPKAVLEELRVMLATERNKPYVSAGEALHWAATAYYAEVKVKQILDN